MRCFRASGSTDYAYYRLKPLDVEIMKRLGTRVNLIPVIAKADTMAPEDLQNFKLRVRVFPPSDDALLLLKLNLAVAGARGSLCPEHQDLYATTRCRG